ncbi:hypothetical protein AB0A70_04950 [Streptomyces morookaense]|uniref:hypothetical protein n=1 Tax=Streptomyces morookaense TaxID=1970 RepID=UPI0033D787A4
MPFTISQGSGTPDHLEPGGTKQFTIDVGLTPDTVTPVDQDEWLSVTFPEGTSFPQPDGKVNYIYHSDGHLVSRPLQPEWDPGSRTLRFKDRIKLTPHEPADGFYSVDVQASKDAKPGVVHGSLAIGGTQGDLRIDILGQENLLKNGTFFKQGGVWEERQGTGLVYAKGAQAIAPWRVGQYLGSKWAPLTDEPGERVDLLQGDQFRGQWPDDVRHPFADDENVLDINGQKSCGSIEQTVTVVPGTRYELSFYTGYHPAREKTTQPTYLRAGVSTLPEGKEPPLAWDDYIQYYTGDYKAPLHKPGWRRRTLQFTVPQGVHEVIVRFANPGYSGFDAGAAAPDGSGGMLLAHAWLETVPTANR